ncbi:zinc finger protein 2 homolog isoform X3 [Eurytemora carolleeae]|uniref:zinc finger protein 2 homolog isoform X3 n=1 Tax=Eurytemora carolleeae TaxID=1294199 RepID=UPI000C78AD5C|nr:zinc finger protein 2 homolog isoform X3 [Eurytemora carolleeae]|eukprot:XP_023333558.1 zinc finger protein 2 homolog isoform X3 [Eurytemora affinis]
MDFHEENLNTSDSSIFNSILMSQIFTKISDDKDETFLKTDQSDPDSRDSVCVQSYMFQNGQAYNIMMQEQCADLNIIVEQSIIRVDQLVLAAHSSLLEHMLKDLQVDIWPEIGRSRDHNLGKEEPKISLILPLVSLSIMTRIVHFLYSGELMYNKSELKEMREIADILKLRFLIQQLQELEDLNLQSLKATPENSEEITEQNLPGLSLEVSCEIGIDTEIHEVLVGNGGNHSEILIGEEDTADLFLCGEKVLFVEGDLETPVQSPATEHEGQEKPCILSDISTLTNINQEHQCDECSQRFFTTIDLENHKKIEHSAVPIDVGEFKCDVCNNFFNTMGNLEEHRRTVHGNKEFSCNLCDKHYTRSHQLKIHKRTHTGERPYPCSDCNKRFIDNTSLKQHMKIHSDELGYKCSLCGKKFKLRAVLRQHEQTHNAERPHKCDICGKGFTCKRNMLRHTEIHTQVNLSIQKQSQLYSCNLCLKPFKLENQLIEHNAAEHPNNTLVSTSLVFRCCMKNCSKVFPSQELLSSHRKIVHEFKDKTETEVENAEPFICSCGVSFSSSRTLKKHQKTSHTSGGPFKCSLCSKGFKNDCSLMKHILDHTDVKMRHICDYCSKVCERPSDLAKHLRK